MVPFVNSKPSFLLVAFFYAISIICTGSTVLLLLLLEYPMHVRSSIVPYNTDFLARSNCPTRAGWSPKPKCEDSIYLGGDRVTKITNILSVSQSKENADTFAAGVALVSFRFSYKTINFQPDQLEVTTHTKTTTGSQIFYASLGYSGSSVHKHYVGPPKCVRGELPLTFYMRKFCERPVFGGGADCDGFVFGLSLGASGIQDAPRMVMKENVIVGGGGERIRGVTDDLARCFWNPAGNLEWHVFNHTMTFLHSPARLETIQEVNITRLQKEGPLLAWLSALGRGNVSMEILAQGPDTYAVVGAHRWYMAQEFSPTYLKTFLGQEIQMVALRVNFTGDADDAVMNISLSFSQQPTHTSSFTFPTPSIQLSISENVTPSRSSTISEVHSDSFSGETSSSSLSKSISPNTSKTHSLSTESGNNGAAMPYLRVLGSLIPDKGAGEIIQGTGTGTAALNGLTGTTTSLSGGVRMNAMLGAVFCRFSESSDAPSWMEALVFSFGDSKLKYFSGSTMYTSFFVALLCCLLQGMEMFLSKSGKCGRRCAKVGGVAVAMATQAYIPSVLGMSTLLFMHSDDSRDQAAAATGAGLALMCTGWMTLKLMCFFNATAVSKTRPGDEKMSDKRKRLLHAEFENTKSNSLFVECLAPTFDACSDSDLLRKRLYFLEELLASSITAVIGGLRPTEGSCYPTAAAMLAVALLHLLYLVVTRPYRTRLDFFFAILFAVNLVLIGILSLATIAAEAEEGVAMYLLGAAVIFQNASMIIQTFCQCGWLYILHERRRFRARTSKEVQSDAPNNERTEDDDEENEEDTGRNDVVLTLPFISTSSRSSQPKVQRNPLLQEMTQR